MRTYTLDTACVIHAVQMQALGPLVEELVALARDGKVALYLTTAFSADMSRASAANLDANLEWLESRPVVRGLPGPFRLDYSPLDGGDVLVSDGEAELITRIEQIVLPADLQVGRVQPGDSTAMDRQNRKLNDVQHLAAHLLAGHDAFVTSDDDDILKKRDRLQRETGVTVLSLNEAVLALK